MKLTPVPELLAGLYCRLMGHRAPKAVLSICAFIEDICLVLFPFEEKVQEELIGGPHNLRMMRLLLLECRREGDEAALSLIQGMTAFYWPN